MVDSYKKNEFGNDIFAPYNAYGSKNNSIPYGEQNSSPYLKLMPNTEPTNAMSQQTEIFNFPAQKTSNYFDTNFPLCDEKPRSTGTSVISFGDSEEGGVKDKKEKNRVSARECRKRKKKYIESLELEVKQLKIELKKSKELIAELRAKELQSEVAGKLQNVQNAIPQMMQTMPTKAAFEPQSRVNMRNMSVAKAMGALIDAMFDTFTKYIVWFPNDTLDNMDKKVKKPLKYISMEHKSAQELVDIITKLNLPHQYLQNWEELIAKKSNIRHNLEYCMQTLIKAKDDILMQLGELDGCSYNIFISTLEESALANVVNHIEDSKHHILLEELNFFRVPSM